MGGTGAVNVSRTDAETVNKVAELDGLQKSSFASCRYPTSSRAARRLQDQPNGLLWLIPHWKMPAVIEPMKPRVGERSLRASRLSR